MNLSPSIGLGTRDFSADATMPPVGKTRKVKHHLAGYGYMRSIMLFMKWAHEQEKSLQPKKRSPGSA
ncbi:hypothetical protein A7X76_07780 [Stenotrophomonas maltophilia]|uniref:hypothetical protein n=1 Tax=Stenotrophomonas maltophilia TaxID=40324 RepID=UPI000DA9F8E0|nr:hypothetical protein [Stenotrophomonas maltophilia]PZS71976.1 hypothetical protein A7X76_07780 [Stenotrophomonas maltophilia]